MCCVEKERETKKALRSLCLSSGWSYGIFWRFDLRNPMLLNLEDVHYEEYAKSVTDSMLLQVPILGEGVIGQAALDGKHRWLYSDSSAENYSLTGHGFSSEFFPGIKTIAVIPIESYGVLQFGSVRKILETPGFVDQAREIFRAMGIIDGLVPSGNATSSLINHNFDQIEQFASLISPYEFEHNVSSIPSSSYPDNQGDIFGFDNQQFASLFHELSSDHGFGEINFQEHHMDDNILQEHMNGDFLQSLIADLPTSSHGVGQTPFVSVKTEQTILPKKGLFSELGLDQLLSSRANSGSLAKSSVEDSSTGSKKRKLDDNWMINSQGDAKSCVTDQTRTPEESSCKAAKKRARPGESNRPRPKDRQMIQDRIKELRDIVPNGAKCSIDSLLDRTIKHMLFMQGVTKNVEKLKRVDEAKIERDFSNDAGSAAWAIDVGGQNPIIVEDLGHSGLLLIEMVCEQRGFFLEIADVIRGFGLTILKGVVEAQDEKIRAQFIVEAKRHVTRVEVLMSLLHLLKDASNDVVGGRKLTSSSALNNCYRQPMALLPIGF